MSEGHNWNFDRPVMYVMHRQMKPAVAPFALECAKCLNGILWTRRDPANTFLPEDTCDICGQRYHYMDANEIAPILK